VKRLSTRPHLLIAGEFFDAVTKYLAGPHFLGIPRSPMASVAFVTDLRQNAPGALIRLCPIQVKKKFSGEKKI
jgi:hypothetical protein